MGVKGLIVARRYIYEDVTDGDKIVIPKRTINLSCCDCALTHTFVFRITKGKITARVWRDNKATKYFRRKRHIEVVDHAGIV